MSLLSMILMMNIKHQQNKILYITLGILISVSIYYINYFFGIIGKNERLPLLIALWLPLIILTLISTIGLIKINENKFINIIFIVFLILFKSTILFADNEFILKVIQLKLLITEII